MILSWLNDGVKCYSNQLDLKMLFIKKKKHTKLLHLHIDQFFHEFDFLFNVGYSYKPHIVKIRTATDHQPGDRVLRTRAF